MAQSSYTDADLPRFARKGFSVQVERPKVPYTPVPGLEDGGDSIDQRLANAKGTLSRAQQFDDSVNTPDEAPAQAGALPDSPSIFDTPAQKLARLGRNILRPIPAAAEKAAGVGMFLAPEVAIPSQAILGLGSAKRLLEGGTERLGAHPIETALDVAGVGLGASGVKQGLSAAGEVAPSALASLRNLILGNPATNDVVKGMRSVAARRGAYGSTASDEASQLGWEAKTGSGAFSGGRTTGHFDPSNIMTGQEEGLGALPRYRQETESSALKGLREGLDSRISGLAPETKLSPEDEAVLKYVSQGGAPQTNSAMDTFRRAGSKTPLLDVARSPKIIPVVK